MSDPLKEMLNREREMRRLMDPLGDAMRDLDTTASAAIRAAAGLDTLSALARAASGYDPATEIARASAVGDLMRRLDDRAELEAMAAGFMTAQHYRDAAFDLAQRTPSATAALFEQMEREAQSAAGAKHKSAVDLAIAAAGVHRDWEAAFRLPTEFETRSLIQKQIEAARAAGLHFQGLNRNALNQAMAGMTHPWLNADRVDQSVRGLMEMQAVGAVLRQGDPFGAEASVALRAALGDWRDLATPKIDTLIDPVSRTALYYAQGYSPDITAFPRDAFIDGLHHAGLDLEDGDEASDGPEDDDDVAFLRNRAAFDQLQRFEVAVRRFIDARMTAAYGADWIATQVPSEISDSWREKQAKDAKVTGQEKPLIEFADFSDYRPIIERKQNWRGVFAPVFGRQSDIQESFQRLYPVRIATMHARMITQDDEMLLTVETRRILTAIRKA